MTTARCTNLADDFTPTYLSGDTDGDGLLDVGETWLYRATGMAVAGPYRNVATVIGRLAATGQEAPRHRRRPLLRAGRRCCASRSTSTPSIPRTRPRSRTPTPRPGRVLRRSARRWCGPTSCSTTGPTRSTSFGVMDDRGTRRLRRRLRGDAGPRRGRLQRRRPRPRQLARPRRGVALHVGRHRLRRS